MKVQNGQITIGALVFLADGCAEAAIVIAERLVMIPPVNRVTPGTGLVLDADVVKSITVTRGSVDVWTQRGGRWSSARLEFGDTLKFDRITEAVSGS